MNRYWVYIMGNSTGSVVYIGVTNNLMRRVEEHRNSEVPGFTLRYRCNELLFYEEYGDINYAIAREKQLKGWVREKKERLIASLNPERIDLAADWK